MRDIALNYIYLSKSHAGGKDQVGLNLLRGFQEKGYAKRMIVFCFDYSSQMIKNLSPDVKIVTISSKDSRNELMRMAQVCFVNTFVIPKLVKEHKVSLVYHLSCNTGLKKLRAFSVVIPHDIKAISHRVIGSVKVPLYKYWIYRIMYHLDFKNADAIIAISETDKSEISQYYPKFKEKIKRIYNPIDVDRQAKAGKPKIEEPYICAVNLQFHHKNIITLIKAFEKIKDQVPYKLLLIGSVPKRVAYLKEYVEEHRLCDKIEFTGFVDDETMNNLFRHSSLYINPTLYEGFGMTAIEAMIYKIPTLVSKIPTNYEITQGLCEYYAPPEDANELARKILECLSKEYKKEDLERAGNQIFESYNYLKISEEYFEAFQKYLRQKGN